MERDYLKPDELQSWALYWARWDDCVAVADEVDY